MFNFLKRRAFKRELRRATADGVLTPLEIRALDAIGVDQDFAQKTRKEQFLALTAPIREEVQKTLRLTPQQEEQLTEIGENLKVEVDFDDTFVMCRELWRAENGEELRLTPTEADIILQKGEVCYFSQMATWAQLKTVMTRTGYSGFSTSVRIMKGVSYRVGNIAPRFAASEQLQSKDAGILYLTNRRLFFKGDKRSTSIALPRILAVEPYVDGIEVTKDRGTNDAFLMPRLSAEFCSMAVQQLLAH